MFQDEARFGRINPPRRCWAPRGIRPAVCSQFVREYTYVYGAVSPSDGKLDTLILPVVNADAMSIFLREISNRYPEEQILMFLDSASWHKANELIIPDNIDLTPLPPYSPQLNPMENMWEEIREKGFKNKMFLSLDSVEDQLMKTLRSMEEDTKRNASIAGFKWIINI